MRSFAEAKEMLIQPLVLSGIPFLNSWGLLLGYVQAFTLVHSTTGGSLLLCSPKGGQVTVWGDGGQSLDLVYMRPARSGCVEGRSVAKRRVGCGLGVCFPFSTTFLFRVLRSLRILNLNLAFQVVLLLHLTRWEYRIYFILAMC